MLDSPSKFYRHYRLGAKQDFQSVFANPRKLTSNHLILLYKTNTLAHPRLGLIIAKQRVKRAVDRNSLRRVIRESFRKVASDLKSVDIIVLMRANWSISERPVVRNELDHLWLQLKNH